jgi:hypothetical protein
VNQQRVQVPCLYFITDSSQHNVPPAVYFNAALEDKVRIKLLTLPNSS